MIDSDKPEWWTEAKIADYFGDGTIAAAHFRAFVAQVVALTAQLEAERRAALIADANLTGDLHIAEDRINALTAELARWQPSTTYGTGVAVMLPISRAMAQDIIEDTVWDEGGDE